MILWFVADIVDCCLTDLREVKAVIFDAMPTACPYSAYENVGNVVGRSVGSSMVLS